MQSENKIAFPHLKQRCTEFSSLTVDQLTRCFLMAHEGVKYEPDVGDASAVNYLDGTHREVVAPTRMEWSLSRDLFHGWAFWGAVICVVALMLRLRMTKSLGQGGPIIFLGHHLFNNNRDN